MDPQEQKPKRLDSDIIEAMRKVKKIDHRTDLDRFKKFPKEVKEAIEESQKKLKEEETEEKVPRKIQKKRDKQAKREAKKNLPPPMCRFLGDIECIYYKRKWPGMALALKERDKLGRVSDKSGFCSQMCIQHIIPKHIETNKYALGTVISKQLSQITYALNVLASQRQSPPQIAEKRQVTSPAVSLREVQETPEKINPKPDKNQED